MNHSVKRRRQALHQTHHHYYLNISVEAANLSDYRIEKTDSVARIESKLFARIGMLYHPASVAGLLLWVRRPVNNGTISISNSKPVVYPFFPQG